MFTTNLNDTGRSALVTSGIVDVDKDASSYDKWLDAEIQEAIDDTSPTIAHDDVMRDVRAVIRQARVKKRASA